MCRFLFCILALSVFAFSSSAGAGSAESAVQQLKRGNYMDALIHASNSGDPALKTAVTWYYLKSSDVIGRFVEYQQFLLETYTVIQSVTRKLPNEMWFVGTKDGLKVTIGDILGSFAGTTTAILLPQADIQIRMATGAFTAFGVKAGTAVLVESMLKWFKENYTKPMNFKDFKNSFESFLAEQKDILGEGFEKEYPLHGFESLIPSLAEN